MSRLLFPQNRTAFLYTEAGEPIRQPWMSSLVICTDEAGDLPADLLDLDEQPIVGSEIFIGEDGLLPEFWGPDDDSYELWVKSPQGPVTKIYTQTAVPPLVVG